MEVPVFLKYNCGSSRFESPLDRQCLEINRGRAHLADENKGGRACRGIWSELTAVSPK